MTYEVSPYKIGRSATLLTAANEQRLAASIEAGLEADSRISAGESHADDHAVSATGRAARRRFIEANLRLVLSTAGKMRAPRHVDRQDMIQDGMLGLERAVDKFDWRRGYKFSTYATWWIRQGIQRGLENTAGTVRIPAHRTSEIHMALAQVDGDYSQLPEKLAAIASMANVGSLDRPTLDGDSTLGDAISDGDIAVEDIVTRAGEKAAVHRLIERLDGTTKRALIFRFGLDGDRPMTYAQVGAKLGVGPEAARQRINRALRDLRGPATALAA